MNALHTVKPIVQKGNSYTNSSSRDGHVPFVIVNHISAGSMTSMDAWFTSPSNTVSSAHYGVSRAGEIHQYVPINRMAWANGLTKETIPKATALIIRQHAPINPNKYTVSIEHEGTDGDLTEDQFQASVWLHRYIADEVKRLYHQELVLDDQHVIGHYQVDPVRKPNCPGPRFPWKRLYQALSQAESAHEKEEESLVSNETWTALTNRITQLEKQADAAEEMLKLLTRKLVEVEKQTVLSPPPAWAQEAYASFAEAIHEPTGSTEFWRLLTILYRTGHMPAKKEESH
ncbi:N-acetylmuramoyl-L-alanine amidase [Gorillibacterium sp. CAU 1737]|uniref:N-acetylmuramoyl-L-alanine amidase n=1 Tax=Gorillibacterium sp. CAU 1737 TaxID=3140362 RepID=UPI0032603428